MKSRQMDVRAHPGIVSAEDRSIRSAWTRGRLRWSTWLGGLATGIAGLPMLIAAALLTLQRPDVVMDGDGALDEIALIRATHFEQLVGNYSRFGWNHPGPAWFYVLAVIYAPLGQQSWGFFAAALVIQAALACIIAAAAWRVRGPALAVVMSLLLLWLMLELGAPTFRSVWPPYATILPIILFFLLAAYGAAGSILAVVGALLIGSYEAQLHVGTLPTIALGILTMMTLYVLWHGWSPSAIVSAIPTRRRPRIWLGLGLLGLVAIWLPVGIDVLTTHPSNLSKLIHFFVLQPGPHHPLHEGVAALGRQLMVFPFGQVPNVMDADSTLTLGRLMAVLAFLVGSGLLVAFARRHHDRFAQAIGTMLAVAAVGLIWSISRIAGDLSAYLILWTVTLPLILLGGWAALALGLWRWESSRRTAIPVGASAIAAGVVILTLASVQTVGFLQLPSPTAGVDRQTRQASTLIERALSSKPHEPVLISISSLDAWPLAAGVALQLMKREWTVSVEPAYVFMFGSQLRATGRERLALVFVPENTLDQFDQHAPGVEFLGTEPTTCPQSGTKCNILVFIKTLEPTSS